MIVGLDATFLLYFFAPAGSVETPRDSGEQPVDFAKERVALLIEDLEKSHATLIVGTPALAEISVRAGVQAAQEWITTMKKSAIFRIVPFDEKSAIEVAIMAGNEIKGDGISVVSAETYAKVKYDRQIVAIAHTEGAKTFYTDDQRQGNLAKRLGMVVRGLEDCPAPTASSQGNFDFRAKDAKPEDANAPG